MADDESLKHTPLEAEHLKLGGRLVPFAGWLMPVQYDGIMAEHLAVRREAGVFDISHMGQLRASGENAAAWLNGLLTNQIEKLSIGQGQYTLLLNEKGGVIDDLIVYRVGKDDFFLVVNASKTDEDFAWMSDHLGNSGVKLVNVSDSYGALAVQGPKAAEVFTAMSGEALPERFGIAEFSLPRGPIIVCRTGYTGEDGFELFCPVAESAHWWNAAISATAKPCGLGARDSLRLEKCYPLNGNDLSPEHTPLEAGLGFAVDLEKSEFIGHQVLKSQKANGLPRRLVAIRITQKSPPPRPHCPVIIGDEAVSELCSGGLSPSLSAGIGMAYVPTGKHQTGTPVQIEIRGQRYAAEIVRKPFL